MNSYIVQGIKYSVGTGAPTHVGAVNERYVNKSNNEDWKYIGTTWIKTVTSTFNVQEVDMTGVSTPLDITPNNNVDIIFIFNIAADFNILSPTVPVNAKSFKIVIIPDGTHNFTYTFDSAKYTSVGKAVLGTDPSIVREVLYNYKLSTPKWIDAVAPSTATADTSKKIQYLANGGTYTGGGGIIILNPINDVTLDVNADTDIFIVENVVSDLTINFSNYTPTTTKGKNCEIWLKSSIVTGFNVTFGPTVFLENDTINPVLVKGSDWTVIHSVYNHIDDVVHIQYENNVGKSISTTVQTQASAATITVNKSTELLIINPLNDNTTIGLETGTTSKKLRISIQGGSVAKTVTLTDGVYIGPNNSYFNSNIFTTDPNKSLYIECTVLVDGVNKEVIITDWQIEGKDMYPVVPLKIAHFDPVNGFLLSDTIVPQLNNPKKPFKSYTEAVTSLGTLTALNRGKIIFAEGTYTAVYQLKDHIDIHAPVLFTDGGFQDTTSTGKNIWITGKPRWNNTTTETLPLEIISDAYVNIDCGDVISADRFLFAASSAKVFVKGTKQYCLGSGNGYGNTFRDTCNVYMELETIECAVACPILCRAGITANFSGNVTIIANKIHNISGNAGANYLTLIVCDAMLNGKVFIKANELIYGGPGYTARKGIVTITNTNDANSYVIVEGKMSAGNAHAYCITYNTGAINIEHISGDITSNTSWLYTEQIISDNPNGIITINNSKIKAKAGRIGKQRTINLYNCFVINTDAVTSNSPIFTADNNSSTNKSYLNIDACKFYTNDGNNSVLVAGTPTGLELRVDMPSNGTCAIGTLIDKIVPSGYRQVIGTKIN